MIYTLPFIAALIGWFTNFLAVKMLFHPRTPVKIGPVVLHGIFPKRQKTIAERLGVLVASELISFKEISGKFQDEGNMSEVIKIIELKMDEFMAHKFPVQYPTLALFVTDSIKNKFKANAIAEIESAMPDAIDTFLAKMENSLDVEQIVYEKVANFSSVKLERLLMSIIEKEFRFIELVGAVLGFIIGLIQIGLVSLTA